MAQRNSSGRGATATSTTRRTGNRTPNTPGISEAEISRMKVEDLRGQLRRRGISGISALRKPELVKTLVRTLRSEVRGGGAARRSTGPSGRAPTRRNTARTSAGATTAAGRAAPARRSAAARAKTTSARAKAAPARAKAAPARRAGPARSAAKAAPAARATRSPGVRTGRSTSRSVRSAQLISSPADRPERPGRSLVTTNHQVIRNWAAARGARPATIAGTERDGRPGVLTFDIPGYRESRRVQVVSWNDWFRTFDGRRLNLIFQEQLRDGRQSNFFRTESPDREDG
ncbi:hypothetical protein [Micromonospora rifamycinica]|uniref:Rho termination factor N-terminal domain-containing protein n=1 Tax=Micromonospora rifamycinica TaxID=291594 RepID=A0A1C5K6I6_9ACTN|nr:hypothetical protein [Micromonospora rifamycinica]SCG78056.1 hypothetical protein GA0070623_4334 [Micromonospora rifamycinica]